MRHFWNYGREDILPCGIFGITDGRISCLAAFWDAGTEDCLQSAAEPAVLVFSAEGHVLSEPVGRSKA